jgi:hypothetical protein
MSSVELSDQEWGQLMSILSEAAWKVANPLLMKIGEQLRAQHQQHQALDEQIKREQQAFDAARGIKLDANGKEVRNE